jgi:hypothetical protein
VRERKGAREGEGGREGERERERETHTHQREHPRTSMHKLRIGRLGFGTGRHKMALERWTTPKLSRRMDSPRYGPTVLERQIGGRCKTAA